MTDRDIDSLRREYRRLIAGRILFIMVLLAVLAVLSIYALSIGPVKIPFGEVVRILLHNLGFRSDSISDMGRIVVVNIRIPRIITAVVSGMSLALAGAVMQVVLRNPLASPFTLGVSSGAGLGASLAIIMGISFMGGRYFLIGNAFLFSLVPALVVFGLSRFRKVGPGMMILAGIAMSYIFSAVSTLISYFSSAEELKSLSLWMMGNLGRATWRDIGPLVTVQAVTAVILFWKSREFNALNAGDETAKSLGVNVERTRITVLLAASLMSAGIVCFTGMIGFVGLVAPHMVRLLIGADNRFLIPASGLFGAAFLLGADILSMLVIEPAVLPIGIVTSFVGGPLFLYLVVKRRRREYW